MAQKIYDDEDQVSGQDDNQLGQTERHALGSTSEKTSTSSNSGGTTYFSGGQVLSASQLGRAESSTSSSSNTGDTINVDSGGFWKNQSDQDSGSASSSNNTKQKVRLSPKKKLLLGGGVGGGVVGILAIIFFSLIPLKIEDTVTNLENHYMATSNSAVGTETDNMVSEYLESRVLPGLSTCGEHVDSSCTSALGFGDNPVSGLYKSWSQARFEKKLESRGISFEYDKKANTWTIHAPDLPEDGVDIGEAGQSSQVIINDIGGIRSAAYASLDSTIQDETLYNKVYLRYKLSSLLEEKYGVKRCLFACNVTDPIREHINVAKNAASLEIADRVILPFNKNLATALKYILNTPDTQAVTNQADSGAPSEGGTEETSAQTQISAEVRAFAATEGITTEAEIEALQNTINGINDKGMSNYLISSTLAKILPSTAADKVTNAIPIIGWLEMASQVINLGKNSSGTLKAFRYAVDTVAAVKLFNLYSSMADEIHTGGDNATEVGSMVDSLGPGNPSGQPGEVGGTSGAEGTPLYAQLNGDGSDTNSATGSTSASLLSMVTGATANALSSSGSASSDTSAPDQYLCNNGQPVPTGQVICPEESVAGGSKYANAVSTVLSDSGLAEAAQLWNDSIGKLFGYVNDILSGAFQAIASALDDACSLPGSVVTPVGGYCAAKSVAETVAPDVEKAVVNLLIPTPFSSNMSGGRKYDMMALGADAEGSDSAHQILGGQQLTPAQVSAITNQQETEAQQQFSQQPLFARMFSTSTQYSLISRLASDIPLESNTELVQTAFSSLISNPFSKISASISSLFFSKTSALTTPQPDPFGVIQYGYPAGTIPTDPEQYWQQNCTDNPATGYQLSSTNNWDSDVTIDPNTEQPVNTTTNPCMLIKAAVGAAGAVFSTSNLNSDDVQAVEGAQ